MVSFDPTGEACQAGCRLTEPSAQLKVAWSPRVAVGNDIGTFGDHGDARVPGPGDAATNRLIEISDHFDASQITLLVPHRFELHFGLPFVDVRQGLGGQGRQELVGAQFNQAALRGATPAGKSFRAPISMTFGNIGLDSKPRNVTRSATLISRPVSTKRPCVRSLVSWAWALYLSCQPRRVFRTRVETGIAIRPEVQKGIHAVERSIAKDFPAGVVRCRVRAKGIVIELDPETLAAIAREREAEVRAQAERIFAGIAPRLDLSFEPYRNGSAFVHSRA